MPKTFTIGTYDKKHKENLAKRARKVQQLYDAAIKRIVQAAAPSLFDADPKKEFHFEDFPALKKEMEALMQDLGSSLQANIEDGDQESWTLSNTKNDAMVDSIIGKKKLPAKTVKAWKHPHLEALNAFIARKEAGMNLSRRVWNLTHQFKSEMELALELGMGEGKSAAALSRDVRKYLVEPNKLFRRVRDKSGALRLSKAAAAYHPGQGVYRSSYKNALRMTATENNIAYRTADHNRWQALPFVIGIEIHISNNHPTEDICDLFDGKRFPKDFKFTGWHPWCRCYAVSVLASQEEMDAYTTAIMNGEDVSHWKFTGQVEKMPKEFNKWMKDNQARIENATSMPYFIKDNFKDGDPAKGLRWEGKKKAKTTLEKAEERHASRTQQQIADIQKRAEERQKRHAMMKQTALDAQAAGKEMPEISTTALTKAINEGNLDKMFNLGQKVQKKVEKMKLAEANMEDLIPNVHEWHKKHTIKELEAAHDAIKKTFDRWTWDFTTDNSLQFLQGRLQREIGIVARSSHSTKEVAKEAFENRLKLVNKRIDMKAIGDSITHELDFAGKTKSAIVKRLGNWIKATLNDNNADLAKLRSKAKELQDKVGKLEAEAAARAAKKAGNATHIQSKAEIIQEMKDAFLKRGKKLTDSEIQVENGLCIINAEQHEFMAEHMMNITREQRKQIWNHRYGYIQTGSSFTINGCCRDITGAGKHAIHGSIINNPNIDKCADLFGRKLTEDQKRTIITLDAAIGNNKTEFPMLVIRNVDNNAIKALFKGIDMDGCNVPQICNKITQSTTPAITPDCGYLSVSTNATKNVFKERRFQLQLEIPKGAQMYVTENYTESECILGRETKLALISAKVETRGGEDYGIIRCRVIP
nr:MAG: minor capsid protein 2 [Bacteriophage sp.]